MAFSETSSGDAFSDARLDSGANIDVEFDEYELGNWGIFWAEILAALDEA